MLVKKNKFGFIALTVRKVLADFAVCDWWRFIAKLYVT